MGNRLVKGVIFAALLGVGLFKATESRMKPVAYCSGYSVSSKGGLKILTIRGVSTQRTNGSAVEVCTTAEGLRDAFRFLASGSGWYSSRGWGGESCCFASPDRKRQWISYDAVDLQSSP